MSRYRSPKPGTQEQEEAELLRRTPQPQGRTESVLLLVAIAGGTALYVYTMVTGLWSLYSGLVS